MASNEGRIVLVLQAYRKGQFSSLRAAARSYDVSYKTLTRRHKGTPSRADFTSTQLELTQTEETTLLQWILSMDIRGILPTQALICEMAEILLAERVQDALVIPPKIGQHWVYCFIKRHPKRKSRYNQKYNY
jgi:Tc5 transposase DNA-binding domain/helix-turn-helix, Psq domain